MKKIVFYHIASDQYKKYSDKMIHSFRIFYPKMPFVVFGQRDIEEAKAKNGVWCYATFGRKLAEQYKIVVEIDADSVVCDHLDEIIKGDYDIAAPLNGSPGGMQTSMPGIGRARYLNAGLHASTSKAFWEEWETRTLKDHKKYAYGEQDILNEIFWSGRYKTKLLDGLEGDPYYGASSCGHYKNIELNNLRLYLYGRRIKVLHTAGQSYRGKLSFFDAPLEVRDFISQLTGKTNF